MDEAGRKKLWEEYSKTRTSELREQIILEYAPLVKVVAGRLSMYLGYNVEYDDLVGYGVFGLIDAIDKFNLSKDIKFETYASLRIRGAILDQIRKMDWIPRTVRQKQKRIEAAIKEIESQSGKNATDEEVARSLGISDEEYTEWQQQLMVTNVVSLNEYADQGLEAPIDRSNRQNTETPEDVALKSEMKEMLKGALELLTEKERKVVLLYYYEELTLKEIADILEVSESRVSQLHTKALGKMRQKIGKYVGLFSDM